MKQRKVYNSTTFGLAMVLATLGLKFDIQPLRRRVNNVDSRTSESLVIQNGNRQSILNLPINRHSISIYTLTTIASRPRFFIVTPSKVIYKLIKRVVTSLLTPSGRTTQVEGVEEGNLLNFDEEVVYDSQQLQSLQGDAIDHIENTRLIQSAIKLNNKRFVKNLKLLLENNQSNLDVEKLLVLIKQALTVNTTAQAERILSEQVHQDLEGYLVLCKDPTINLFRRLASHRFGQ